MSTIEELQKLREREDHVEFKKAEHNYPFAGGQKTDPRDRRHCVLGLLLPWLMRKGAVWFLAWPMPNTSPSFLSKTRISLPVSAKGLQWKTLMQKP